MNISLESTPFLNEGHVSVTGGKIWYKIVGEADKMSLLLLHGGPGAPSYYLNPLAALSVDRQVIFFDQLGCGRSGRELDKSLMTIENHIIQVEKLCEQLNLKKFCLYSSSWGAVMAIEFYLRHPEMVSALIFSSPCLSTKQWIDDAKQLIALLPEEIQHTINRCEEQHDYGSDEYQQAMQVFYDNFLSRKHPLSEDLQNTFSNMNAEIYQYMWGASEFSCTGTLNGYDRIDKLSEIEVPTLFIGGEYDEARPSTIQHFSSLVPDSQYSIAPNAGHMTIQDNSSHDIQAIKEFLKRFETSI